MLKIRFFHLLSFKKSLSVIAVCGCYAWCYLGFFITIFFVCMLIFIYLFIIHFLWVRLSSFVQTALFRLMLFILSMFRFFVYKPARVTMTVCVLSCAYCCHCNAMPLAASTCCKVRKSDQKHGAVYLLRQLDLVALLLPLTLPHHPPSLHL